MGKGRCPGRLALRYIASACDTATYVERGEGPAGYPFSRVREEFERRVAILVRKGCRIFG